jgi:hypothetical protein
MQVVHSFCLSDLTGKCEEMASDDIKEYSYSYAETGLRTRRIKSLTKLKYSVK